MRTQWILVSACLLGILCIAVRPLGAMPNFARRYNMSCSGCHSPVPRLNEFGYKFRAAGFRMPDEIGKGEASKEYSDYIAVRAQSQYNYASTVGSSNNTGVNTAAKNQLNFLEGTFYPLTGAFGKHLASMTEFTFSSEDFWEIENAYLRLNYGSEHSFWTIRFGIFHPFEGFGASDRPLGISRPLIQTSPARTVSGSTIASTYFTPWGFDEVGIEAGYSWDRLDIRATVFNGIYYDPAESKAFPAQSFSLGNLVKPAGESYNAKDYQLFVNYILDSDGGGISGYFYTGAMDLPAATSSSGMFQNRFYRYGVYAGYPFAGFRVNAGLGLGSDHQWRTDATKSGGGFIPDSLSKSMGFFGELDYSLNENWNVGARYDSYDPLQGDLHKHNEINAVSGIVNWCLNDGLQFIGEGRIATALQGLDAQQSEKKKTDYGVTLRAIFLW